MLLILFLFYKPTYSVQQQYKQLLESDNVKQMFNIEINKLKKEREKQSNKVIQGYYDSVIKTKELAINNIFLIKNIPDIKYLGRISNNVYNNLYRELMKDNLWGTKETDFGVLRSKLNESQSATNSYIVINMDIDNLKINYNDIYKKIKNEVKVIEEILSEQYDFIDGRIGKFSVAKLYKNKDIPPHIDSGVEMGIGCRIHIPLITNEKVIFNSGDTSMHLPIKNMYEINNTIIHSVNNRSNMDRVHIIIDYFDMYNIKEQSDYFYKKRDNLDNCSEEIQKRLLQI